MLQQMRQGGMGGLQNMMKSMMPGGQMPDMAEMQRMMQQMGMCGGGGGMPDMSAMMRMMGGGGR